MQLKNTNPLLSISCLTFNHVFFIKKCLDGFLMQKTTFPIEVIIHDDCSTDGTREIIEEYSRKYPDIIFPIFQTENQYSNGVRGFMARFNFPRCRGKYIALCEGDDYWTDPYKLQKQVDFLEANDDYVICGHDAKVIDEKGIVISESKLPDSLKRDVSSYELKMGFLLLTSSLVFRNLPILKNYPKEGAHVLNGDTFLISILGQWGKFKFMHEIKPSVCRVHKGGVWSMKSDHFKSMNILKTFFYMAKYHKKNDVLISKDIFLMTFKWGNSLFISCLNKKLKFSEIIFILRYTIIAHYKIKGLNKTIIFSIKKVFRLFLNIKFFFYIEPKTHDFILK